MYKYTKLAAIACLVAGLVSCSDDIETITSRQGTEAHQLAFDINLQQDWNALNHPAQSAEQLAAGNYSIKTGQYINGQEVYLEATTINGILAPANRRFDRRQTETSPLQKASPNGPLKGMQVNTKDEFYNSFGLLGYTVNAGVIGTPDFLYNQPLTRNGNIWSADISKTWDEEATTRFYAYAPYNGSGITLSAETVAGEPSISYVTPTDVTAQQDLMVNSVPVDVLGAPQGPLGINFRHVLSAVRFKIGSKIQTGVIKKIELQNVKYKGTYDWATNTWTLDDEATNFEIEPNQVTIGDNGENLEGTYLGADDEIFFLPPQDLPDNATAVITLSYRENSTQVEKTLRANLKNLGTATAWQQGHTTTYSIRTKEYHAPEYYFEVVEDQLDYDLDGRNNGTADNLPFTVVSYKQNGSGISPNKEAVTWKITGYSYDGGTTWTTRRPAWFSCKDGYNGGAQIVEEHPADLEERDLDTEFSKRVPVEDFDLSTHNFNYKETKRNTANCYIVNRPGSYKLPLVYGNGIKNGVDNKVAYNPGSDSRFPKLYNEHQNTKNFVNHLDQDITSPWIKENAGCSPSGAEIVWQDAEDLVTNVRVEGDYLCFDMDAAHIKGGNSIVAVTDGSGTILWSWHIWVTDRCAYRTWPSYYKDYAFSYSQYYEPYQPITQEIDWNKEQLLMGFLGQNATEIDEREVLVRFEQEVTGYTDVLKLTQEGLHVTIPAYSGMPLYYQWGRKDPMVAAGDNLSGNATTYNASRPWTTESKYDAHASVGSSIQNPNVFYTSTSSYDDWREAASNNYNRMVNLWNGIGKKTITSKGDGGVTSEGVGWYGYTPFEKTIYDPCPVGYRVPDPCFFFYQYRYVSQAAGTGFLMLFSVNGSYDGTIYRCTGTRSNSTGAVVATARCCTWTDIVSHEETGVHTDIQYNTPYFWYTTENSMDGWGVYVTWSSDFGSIWGNSIIPVKEKDWPDGWDFQP